jgi:hypothetical protein
MIHSAARGRLVGALALGLWAGALACDSSSTLATKAECTPGAVARCACPSGPEGTRICTTLGQYGSCGCAGGLAAGDGGASASDGALVEAGSADAAREPGGDAGGALVDGSSDVRVTPDGAIDQAPAASGCVPAGMIASGKERLLDVFTTADGIIVVTADGVSLRGRDGVAKTTVKASRPFTTASFDGTYLAVADAAALNVYSPALQSLGSVLLTEPCASSVMVDGGVFVCGPANDWDRVYYTYSAKDRTRLAASSKKYTYDGIPMRRVPGTNYFIAVTVNSSPSDFHLFRVEPNGTDVVYINESPYHGAFAASMIFGYAGTPPTHLVNSDGLLLKLFDPGCTSTMNSFNTGCFLKDGNLGTLWPNEGFASLANDDRGMLYSVVSIGSTSYYGDGPCKNGCAVQQIDVEKRKVVSQRKHMLGAKRILVSQPDPTCKMVAVGYEVTAGSSSSSFDWSGYQVDLLDYGME